MDRRRLMLIALITAAVGATMWVWLASALRQPEVRFGGVRFEPSEQRWYVELRVKNRSSRTITCNGYVTERAGLVRTNESMLDFKCTVKAEDGRKQSWPLWFATWLDLKPGETAVLSLNFDPKNPPTRVALRYMGAQEPPGRLGNPMNTARRYIRLLFRVRLRNSAIPVPELSWCPTKIAFDPSSARPAKSQQTVSGRP